MRPRQMAWCCRSRLRDRPDKLAHEHSVEPVMPVSPGLSNTGGIFGRAQLCSPIRLEWLNRFLGRRANGVSDLFGCLSRFEQVASSKNSKAGALPRPPCVGASGTRLLS